MKRQYSNLVGISFSKKPREYFKQYQKQRRYIFSINLDKEKDADLIKIIETYKNGNRQGAVKELLLLGYSVAKTSEANTEG